MGTFVAKLKDDDQHWFKLKDNVQNEDYEEIRLDDTVIYDPNNTDRVDIPADSRPPIPVILGHLS